jgi:hypothetical protein
MRYTFPVVVRPIGIDELVHLPFDSVTVMYVDNVPQQARL